MEQKDPNHSDLELTLMFIWAWFVNLAEAVKNWFIDDTEVIDGVSSIHLEREPHLRHSGIVGKLRIDEEEYLTLEPSTHDGLLPNGAYVVDKDSTGAIFATNGVKVFYFTASRYHPKDGQIVLGTKYKTMETTKSKKLTLLGGIPTVQEFRARFDLKLPAALLVTTLKENEIGVE